MDIILKKRRRNYPLIQTEDLVTPIVTDEWVVFVDQRGLFIGKGYLGKQHKGNGWILSWQDIPFDEPFFVEKFLQAKGKRQRYYQEAGTTAFRIFNGEGDGIGGVTIDLYSDFVVFSWYNETLYTHRQELVAAFQKAFPEVKGAYEKIRFSNQELPESRHLYGLTAPEPLIVQENFVNYATYLNEGLMTGIFLDQKEVRGRLVEGLAAGGKVLNMFSYTGAFSVAAAMGGASQTTSVDLAKRSLEKTSEQFTVNGLDLAAQKIHVMDVFNYFSYAQKKGLSFDTIVLDPPSFARNKKKVFTVAKNYSELVIDSVAILNDGGYLITSTNAANLTVEKFRKIVEEGFQKAGVRGKLQEEYHLPGDFVVDPAFPEGDYLKVFIYQVNRA